MDYVCIFLDITPKFQRLIIEERPILTKGIVACYKCYSRCHFFNLGKNIIKNRIDILELTLNSLYNIRTISFIRNGTTAGSLPKQQLKKRLQTFINLNNSYAANATYLNIASIFGRQNH